MWNLLPHEHKSEPSLYIFRNTLIKKDKDRSLFRYGPRRLQLLLARIRMGCSALNGHLYHFLKVLDSPKCCCNYYSESPTHYFLSCPIFAAHRVSMLERISNITRVNINVILFGDKNCSKLENESIFDAVFDYMKNTKRFKIADELF